MTPRDPDELEPEELEPEEPDAEPEAAEPETVAEPEPEPEPDAERVAEPRSTSEPEPAGVVAGPATPRADRGATAKRVALLGARVVTGAVGVAVAVAVVAAVSLIRPPGLTTDIPTLRVEPVPAALVRVCPGTVLRLGDDAGQNAGSPTTVGQAAVEVTSEGTEVETTGLEPAPADPRVLRATADPDAELAGAQSQSVDTRALLGLAAAACREPSSSAWLVAGDAGTGRTSLLTLSNPTEVEATVTLRIWGEGGAVSAPGLTGIIVPAGAQLVLPLAGFAPGVRSPAVQVDSRGGQVVAALQQHTIRAVDPGGVEITGDTSAPSQAQSIPGVTFATLVETGSLIGREGYQDLGAVLRVLAPGTTDTTVRVSLVPESPASASTGTSFEVPITAGIVQEIPLQEIAAGSYTVRVEADVPVVAGVRVSTAEALVSDDPLEAPVSDFAWFASADALDDRTLVSVPRGPAALVHLVNDGDDDATVTVSIDGGAATELVVPASGAVALPATPGAELALDGTADLRAAVTMTSGGSIATFVLSPPQPVSEPIVVHP